MKNKSFLRLCLILAVMLLLFSCRNDLLPEKETYHNSGAFQLTSKRISLNDSKHKAKLLPELSKAENALKTNSKSNVSGKIVHYGNGVSIDTDDVIYIENGPNYHTYTFSIDRENAPADAPLENLVLSPLTDGTYKEFLVSYALTAQEKQSLLSGNGVDTKGKVTVTELEQGTFTGNGQLDKGSVSCGWVQTTVWVPCSSGDHNQHNWWQWHECVAPVPPSVYTVISYACNYLQAQEPQDGGGGGGSSSPGSGGGEGGIAGSSTACEGASPYTQPQTPGLTPPANDCSGVPTEPNVGSASIDDPCEKLNVQGLNPEFTNRIQSLKNNLPLKKETGYVEKTNGSFEYKDNASSTENSNSLTLGDPTPDMIAFLHTHPNNYTYTNSEGYEVERIGFKIFSPADVIYFNQLVSQAQQNGIPLGDIYAVMVSASGTYQIRFTGNVNQIKTVYTNTKEQYNKMYINYFTNNKKRSDELNFLKFIDEEMYVKGITLVKMNDNGTFTKKTLNADKTQVTDANCPN